MTDEREAALGLPWNQTGEGQEDCYGEDSRRVY